jgi:hypothetical protein
MKTRKLHIIKTVPEFTMETQGEDSLDRRLRGEFLPS